MFRRTPLTPSGRSAVLITDHRGAHPFASARSIAEAERESEADDPCMIRCHVGPRESGDVASSPAPSGPVADLGFTGVELVPDVVLVEWLDRAEAMVHSSKGVGRRNISAVLTFRRPFRETRRSRASHTLASSTTWSRSATVSAADARAARTTNSVIDCRAAAAAARISPSSLGESRRWVADFGPCRHAASVRVSATSGHGPASISSGSRLDEQGRPGTSEFVDRPVCRTSGELREAAQPASKPRLSDSVTGAGAHPLLRRSNRNTGTSELSAHRACVDRSAVHPKLDRKDDPAAL